MSTGRPVIRGLAWDHPRGIGAARAAAAAYHALRPDVRVEWDTRPLWKFAYMPLDEMFGRYDVVLFDHPTIGTLVDGQPPMVALDDVIAPDRLAEIARDSIGPTYGSYTWRDQQWAAPVDAAAQVSAYRPDLMPDGLGIPSTWADVEPFARELAERGVAIGLPMNYSDAAVNLCTLGYQIAGELFYRPDHGFDRPALQESLHLLDLLVRLADRSTLAQPPVALLAGMADGSSIGYMPLQFGYVNYAKARFARHLVLFTAPPSPDGCRRGSSLGGVGIAISRTSRQRLVAADFVEYIAGSSCQRGPYFAGGGQPSNVGAWTDPDIDSAANGFFSATRDTMDGAVVRPRLADCSWFFDQQVEVGHRLCEAAESGQPLHQLEDEVARIDRRRARMSGAT